MLDVAVTLLPPTTIEPEFRMVRPDDNKLSSSSSSTGLFGVIATVSLKHKQAQ